MTNSKRESGMVICFLQFYNTRTIMLARLAVFSFVMHEVLDIWFTDFPSVQTHISVQMCPHCIS